MCVCYYSVYLSSAFEFIKPQNVYIYLFFDISNYHIYFIVYDCSLLNMACKHDISMYVKDNGITSFHNRKIA